MTRAKLFISAALFLGATLITACSHILSTEQSLPAWHPEAVADGRVACTECHEDQVRGILKSYASFNHSATFIGNHRYYAARDDRLCATCHKSSFCNDCHANELEIKPSIRYGERPDRELVHRGDYITRHKIDGKTDPTGCYRCHGRTNNEQCLVCHR